MDKPLSFSQREQICEKIFAENGPYWHLYSDGTKMQDIFICPDDFKMGLNSLAACKLRHSKIKILTFEIMNNHFHLILSGAKRECEDFFVTYLERLKLVFRSRANSINWINFIWELIPIKDLRALRNEITYAHRNAYVASDQFNPFNYPWGGGCAYFNRKFLEISISKIEDLSIRKKRELCHTKDVDNLKGLTFCGDVVMIESFCDIRLGEQLFTNAQSYFNALTKNIETYSQIANRLKDSIFLTDDELFKVAVSLAEKNFDCQMNLLNPEQKINLAKELHHKYNASNQQLRRILKLDIAILSELFPS